MTAQSDITSLYIGYFDRAPDPAGLSYWVGRSAAGMSLLEIANSFAVQSESLAEYSYLANPNGSTPVEFITAIYENLFDRGPDAAGLNYWLNQLESGTPPGRMVVDIISGAQGDDALAVANQVSVGLYYVSELQENDCEYTRESAIAVIDEVTADPATVIDGYAEVDEYCGNWTPGPEPEPPIVLPPIGPTVSDVLGTIDNIVDNAIDLGGGLLGGIFNLLDDLLGEGGTVGNVLNFLPGISQIDLSDLNLSGVTGIINHNSIIDLSVNDVFDGGSIARVTIGGESLILVDVDQNDIFEVANDLQLLGLGQANIADFIL